MSNAELQQRIDALSEEIRHYPGPIARCDLHLPALLEERSKLIGLLRRREDEGSCTAANTWVNDGAASS